MLQYYDRDEEEQRGSSAHLIQQRMETLKKPKGYTPAYQKYLDDAGPEEQQSSNAPPSSVPASSSDSFGNATVKVALVFQENPENQKYQEQQAQADALLVKARNAYNDFGEKLPTCEVDQVDMNNLINNPEKIQAVKQMQLLELRSLEIQLVEKRDKLKNLSILQQQFDVTHVRSKMLGKVEDKVTEMQEESGAGDAI